MIINSTNMTRYVQVLILLFLFTSLTGTKTMASDIREETVTYSANGFILKGFIAWDGSIKGKLPVVLVVHEWWGLNDYPKMRARMLAGLGYFAFAVDMYGDGKTADDPQGAMALASPFYKDPGLAKTRLDAALAKLKDFPQADAGNTAAIGYCFGGSAVLNCARMGSDLRGVVSFHGGLQGAPADRNLLKAKILVCNGGNDKSVTQQNIDAFRHQLDSIHADYKFVTYPGATHAFTNPASTPNGKKFNLPIEYNAAADKESWEEMKKFLKEVFARN